MPRKLDLLPGTLELLILKVLSSEPLHGYGITQELQALSRMMLQIEEGSLYPALYRMEKRGWILSVVRRTENNRRARYYDLTPEGRKQLRQEERAWRDYTRVVSQVLSGEQE